jgi:hypothetical protein
MNDLNVHSLSSSGGKLEKLPIANQWGVYARARRGWSRRMIASQVRHVTKMMFVR